MVNFLKKAMKIEKQIIEWRRFLHQHPEIGFDLPKTSRFVEERLEEIGLEVKKGVGQSGVVGILEGGEKGKTIAIRADMDALRLEEKNQIEYSSRHPGRMHACGHDGHVAIALGAAKLLSNVSQEIKGKVKFIFQPGEEGFDGARQMIKDGVLESPNVDAMIGLHLGVLWDIPSGSIGVKKGPIFASTDTFQIKITGEGGHGAMPHKAIDVIALGCQTVSTLQQIVSRKVDPTSPTVLSFCTFNSGTAPNIIPDSVEITGTVRTMEKDIRKAIPEYMDKIIGGIVESFGAKHKLEFNFGYPAVENNSEFTDFFAQIAEQTLGEERVYYLDKPTMVGEDMAYFLQKVPGTFFYLASGTEEKGTAFPNHSNYFNIDEEVLKTGSSLLAQTAYSWLNKEAGK